MGGHVQEKLYVLGDFDMLHCCSSDSYTVEATLEHGIPWLNRKNQHSGVLLRYTYVHLDVKLEAFHSKTIYATTCNTF